jgi:hypothetical protein
LKHLRANWNSMADFILRMSNWVPIKYLPSVVRRWSEGIQYIEDCGPMSGLIKSRSSPRMVRLTPFWNMPYTPLEGQL